MGNLRVDRVSARLRATGVVLAAALAVAGSPAAAGSLLDEVRLGVLDHNAEPSGNEDGIDANFEVLFRRLETRTERSSVVDYLASPRPHLGATLNLDGDTNVVYGGLTWDVPLGDLVALEASFGAAVHDGPLDDAGIASYGCVVNFRESLGLGFELGGGWRVQALVDHMSNADLCRRNRGLTNAGLRLGSSLD